MSLVTTLIGWGQRRGVNPVLVKESRQAVRSMMLTSVFLLMLLGLALISLLVLASQDGDDSRAGSQLYYILFTVLELALGISAGVLFFRTHRERDPEGADLLYITTLTPGQIVRGKLLAGCGYSAMTLSAGLPFLVLSYLLRGVSLFNIGVGLLVLFMIAVLVNLWAVVCASYPGSVLMKVLMLIGPVPVLLMSTSVMVYASERGGSFEDGWPLLVLAGFALLFALIYSTAVFLLSAGNANRAQPFRLTLSVILLLLLGVLSVVALVDHSGGVVVDFDEESILATAAGGASLILLLGLVMGMLSGDTLSRRVQAELPKSWIGRLLVMPFCENRLSAFLWFTLAAVGTLVWMGGVYLLNDSTSGDAGYILFAMALAWAYLLTYAVTARGLAEWLRPRFPGISLVVLFFLLQAMAVLGTLIVGALLADGNPEHCGFPLLGNTAAFVLEEQVDVFGWVHLIFIGLWLVVLRVLNWRWFREVRRQFFPVTRPLPPPLPVERVDG